ncbi:hypothetical protein JKG68_28555 [Microvirga aerilata]|uniref:Uncharacterized protein n=1 Tax=Microvirga aerilata TaxID=670292 RepID=A0A936ZNC1_9HYPH|nr:hypothetical protein [Microvirga aerilata]MBL0407859.1 hypothetical protein [Microvirga aerilata]
MPLEKPIFAPQGTPATAYGTKRMANLGHSRVMGTNREDIGGPMRRAAANS